MTEYIHPHKEKKREYSACSTGPDQRKSEAPGTAVRIEVQDHEERLYTSFGKKPTEGKRTWVEYRHGLVRPVDPEERSLLDLLDLKGVREDFSLEELRERTESKELQRLRDRLEDPDE